LRALLVPDAEEGRENLVGADDGVGALEAAAEDGVDAEDSSATGVGPVEQELLEMGDLDVPELAGFGADHSGGSDAGLEHGNFAEAIAGTDVVEMDFLTRRGGAHLIRATEYDVEIQIGFSFANDDLSGRGHLGFSIGAESFARLIVHESEDA